MFTLLPSLSNNNVVTDESIEQQLAATPRDVAPPQLEEISVRTSYSVIPSRANIRMEDRTLGELQTMGIWDLDTEHPSSIDTCAWRAVVCLVCVGLVWITSTPVIYSMVNYAIPHPSLDETWATWKVVVNTALTAISNADSCTDNQYEGCMINMYAGIDSFEQSMQDTFLIYEKADIIGKQLVNQCYSPYSDVLKAFSTHISWGGPVVYNQNCTVAEIVKIRGLVGDTSNSTAWEIVSTLDTIGTSFNGQFSNITTSMQARVWYDNYYWNGTIQNINNDLLAMKSAFKDLESTWNNFITQFDVLNPLDIFPTIDWDTIHPLDDIKTWMNTLSNVWYAARTAWKDIGNIAKKFGLHIGDVDIVFPLDILDLDDIEQAFDSGKAYITTIVSQEITSVSNEVTAIVETTTGLARNTISELESDITKFVDSFSPIDIDFDELYNEFGINKTVTTLKKYVTELSSYAGEVKSDVKSIVEEVLGKIELLPSYLSKFDIPAILYSKWEAIKENVEVQRVLHVLDMILTVVLVFDIIYRVQQTIQVVIYYLQQTISTLPVIDLRRDGDQSRPFDFLSKLPWSFLSSVTTILLVVAFILGSFIYIVMAYVELYQYYIDGCVKGNDGTFLADNANQLTYNICNDTSRFYRWTQEQEYTATRWLTCKNISYTLNDEYLHLSINTTANQQLYTNYYNNLQLINKCIDATSTYTNINPIVITNTSATYYLPIAKVVTGSYLKFDPTEINPTLISQNIISTLYSVGDCTSFAMIDFPFNGFQKILPTPTSCSEYVPDCDFSKCYPDDGTILSANVRSSCYTWWFIHSFIIRWVLILLTIICVNVSRIFVIAFLTSYLYDKLGSDTVDILEFYKYRECVSTISDRDRKKAIYRSKEQHKCRAILFLFIAVLCNVPWVTFLFYFLKNSSPQENL